MNPAQEPILWLEMVAVFLPVLFLGGVLGRLLREFSVTTSVAILLSGLTSLTLTPMLCSRFLKCEKRGENRVRRRSGRMYDAMQGAYESTLNRVLRHRRVTLIASLGLTALTIYLFVLVPKSFMPAVDVGHFSGSLEASQDNSFERMVAYGQQVNDILATLPWMESNLSGVYAQNAGWFFVNLVNDRHRPNIKVILAGLRERFD